MMQKSFRRVLALLLALTFVMALGGVQAFADTATEPVQVNANSDFGDKSASYDSIAVAEVEAASPHMPVAIAYAQDGKTAELTVTGDVSGAATTGTTLGTEGVAVDAADVSSSAYANIGGNVTIEAAIGSSGVTAMAGNRLSGQVNPNLQGAVSEITVGGAVSVTVSDSDGREDHANGAQVYAVAGAESSVEVAGDVSSESGYEAFGVLAETGADGTASLDVGGDVTAKAGVFACGVNVHGEGDTSVTVEGNVSGEADDAQGIYAHAEAGANTEVEVDGNVTAVGETGAGVLTVAKGQSANTEVSVGGNVSGTATNENYSMVGVDAEAVNGGIISVEVGGDITVDSAGNGYGVAAVVTKSGSITVDVGGSVEANGGNGFAFALVSDFIQMEGNGNSVITVEEDAHGKDAGLYVQSSGDSSNALADVTVGGTLSAGSDDGVAVMVSEQVTEDNLKLTVWKVELNENGNAVEARGGEGSTAVTESNETTQAIEQNINYIIKVEQPKKGATLSAVKADGSALDKSGDYEVAREGETVLMKVNVQSGYRVTGAYNGQGEKVELLKDENGNYYVEVPKGGAVYLSATLEAIPAPSEDTGGGAAVIPVPADKNDEEKQAEEAAEKAEAAAVNVITESTAEDEAGETVVVAAGKLDGNTATEEMKKDFEALSVTLVDAGRALEQDTQTAIPAELKEKAGEGVAVTAGQPFRSVASKYPATVTVKLDNPDSFVGLMAFIGGKWVNVDVVINADGTMTYVLTEPAVLSFVSNS